MPGVEPGPESYVVLAINDHGLVLERSRAGAWPWSDYWRSLALGWLEAGWPIDIAAREALATVKGSPQFSLTNRHRASTLWRSAIEA